MVIEDPEDDPARTAARIAAFAERFRRAAGLGVDSVHVVCHDRSMATAELLAAVQRTPDVVNLRLVLADALQACGDPQGELIVVHHAMASGGDGELAASAARLVANLEATMGVPAGARLEWRLGFVDALDLRGATSAVPDTLFQHRAFALLRDLRPPDQVTASNLEAWLPPVAPTLRRLRVGHPQLRLAPGVIEVISRAIGLEHLKIASNKAVLLSTLDGLPLRSLALRARGLSLASTVTSLEKLSRSLSRLTLHLAGCKGELATLEPVIAGAVLPTLTHLGLIETPFAAAFVERLATGVPRTTLRSFVVTPAPVEVLERHREALAALAVEESPDDAEAASGEIARMLALGLERHAEAIPFYDRAIALDPHSTQLPWSRAISLRSLGRTEEAVAGWDAIIARRPSAPALRNRHIALVALERRVEARADLERALAIKPEAVDIHHEIGDLDRYFGHFESATARYRLALAHNRTPTRLRGLALSLLFQRRELDEARAILDALVGDGEDSGLLHVARGFAWLDADPHRAIEAFAAARHRCGGCDASCGEFERATIGTALAHSQLGAPATALDTIGRYTQNADCLAHLCVMQLTRGIIHRLAGDERSAREELERLGLSMLDPEAIALQLARDHETRHPGKARVRVPGGEPAPFDWKTDQAMAAVCALFAAAITGEPLAPRVARLLEWVAATRPWSMQMWCEALPLLDRARGWMAERDASLLTDVLAAIAWPDHPLCDRSGLVPSA